jgi:HlyD family secretion protein
MKRPWVKLIVIASCVLCAGWLAWLSWQRIGEKWRLAETKAAPEQAARVAVQKVRRLDVRDSAVLIGKIKPMAEVQMMSKVPGRLDELRLEDGTPVDEGLRVKKGQRIAVIDHDAFAAQLEQAQAALEALEADKRKMDAGARPEEVKIAEANVAAAQTGVAAAEADAARAKATLDNAEASFKRVQGLFKDKVTTQQQLDDAQAAYRIAVESCGACRERVRQAQEQHRTAQQQLELVRQGAREEDRQALAAQIRRAQAAVRQARIQLDESTIEAPLDGVIAAKHLDEGNMIGPSTPIVTIVQIDTVKVPVGLTERQVRFVTEGKTRASIRVDAYPDETFEGTVQKVSPVADPMTLTVELELHARNPQGRLKPGMFARATILLQDHPQALVVPDNALADDGTGYFVYVVKESVARRTPVKIGLRSGPNVEVVEGLGDADQVVTRGLAMLSDGARVTVEQDGQLR